MSPSHRRYLVYLVLAFISIAALTGLGCRRPNEPTSQRSNEILVWGLWQESAHLDPVIKAFEDQFGAKVTYRKIASVATYERDLLEALAEGRGPDVFVIHHTWVESKRRIMTPAPSTVVDVRAVQEEFVDVVTQDLIRDGQIYALPTSVDTLALYYNKDLFNAAGIARPPRTWTDYQQTVERLTQVNRLGVIQQSGAALGTAANVNRAPDILQILMLQSGLPIIDPRRSEIDIANDVGNRSVTFYTDFANKAKRVFTWNLQQDFSIDAFAEGETATMINYSYHIPTVRAKNPRLDFAVAPLPQIAGSSDSNQVNFAAYWPFTVSNSSPSTNIAWQFVRFMTNTNAAALINDAQGVPPARRDAVVELQRDPELGVFAEQALTAQSWARPDIAATDAIFNTMIDSVITGAATISDALEQAEDQLNQLNQLEQEP